MRWYDPYIGRFLTRDPIGIWGDPMNLGNGTAYVGNNPWSYVDPYGLECKEPLYDFSTAVSKLGPRTIRAIGDGLVVDPTGGELHRFLNAPPEIQDDLLRQMDYKDGVNGAVVAANITGEVVGEVATAALGEVVTAGVAPAAEVTVLRMVERAGEVAKAVSRVDDIALAVEECARGESQIEKLLRLVDELDFSTPKNGAVFYSGDFPNNYNRARQFAKENNRFTIEMTEGGKILEDMDLWNRLTKTEANIIWSRASTKFAESASGNAVGFVKGAGPEGIFNSIESPILERNGILLITGGH